MAGTVQFIRARDSARALGRFTRAEYEQAVGLSAAAAGKHIAALVQVGIVEEVERGVNWCGVGWVPVYEYVKPSGTATPREKRPPVEVEAAKQFRNTVPQRGKPIVASGRRRRQLAKEAAELLARAEASGFTSRPAKHSFIIYRPDGFPVTSIPKTPSDWRSLKNCLAQLRQAGFEAVVT